MNPQPDYVQATLQIQRWRDFGSVVISGQITDEAVWRKLNRNGGSRQA